MHRKRLTTFQYPLGEPEDPDDEPMPDRASSGSNERSHGMLFRKGHPVSHVWVRQDFYEDMVEDIAPLLHLQPHDILGIHYIIPEPFDRPHIGFSALVRCVGDQYPDTTECLALVDVFIYNRDDEPQEPALFRSVTDLPPLLTRRQLLERIGLEPMCAARRNRCLVKVEGQTVPLQHTGPIFVQHGSYVTVRVPPFVDEDFRCEGVSLMQTRSTIVNKPAVQREFAYLHLFRMSSFYSRVRWALHRNENTWLREQLLEIDTDIVNGIITAFEVHHPPRDLELTKEVVLLIEGEGDRATACQRDDKLVLVDLDIRQSSTHWDNHQTRKVLWSRSRVTRTSLLTSLRVHHFCIAESFHGCHVYLNHVEIVDETIRAIEDGDYLRVVIFGRNRPWDTFCELKTFEEHDRARRIFEDTSEEPDGSTHSSQSACHTHVLDRWCGDTYGRESGERSVRQPLGDITNIPPGMKSTEVPIEQRQGRVKLSLEELIIDTEETEASVVHFQLEGQGQTICLEPNNQHVNETDIYNELLNYGIVPRKVCGVCCDGHPAQYVAFSGDCNTCFIEVIDTTLARWKQCENPITELGAMKILFDWGYPRAYVAEIRRVDPGLVVVVFYRGGFGEMKNVKGKDKHEALFPELRCGATCPLSSLVLWNDGDISCKLNADLSPENLSSLFGSGVGVLRRDFDFLELMPWMEAEMQIAEDTDLAKYHHLRVFVDGSSDPGCRLCHPLEAESFGTLDSWAFAVIGVDHHGVEWFVGWSGHCVIYDDLSPHHVGARTLCSASAEREALFWAGLWRLSHDSNIPTYFCFDSTTAGLFASGLCGAPEVTKQHLLLRGLFQCLESALGHDGLAFVHIYGHQGHLWNEFVDIAAKFVGRNPVFTPRQALDLQTWQHRIPYLWMIFDRKSGLPSLHREGFNITPPELPAVTATDLETTTPQDVTSTMVKISAATLNVRTLLTGGQRDSGKTSYLMEQFKGMNFNLIGIQEARTNEGMSKTDGFLRYRSGGCRGNYGVELWVSLSQPVGYGEHAIKITANDVTICHKDPRRLLARIEKSGIDLLVLVIHAPHSGHGIEEVEQWWIETADILNSFHQGGRVIVLGDCNARSGTGDGKHIFDMDDVSNKTTGVFRDFLSSTDLCAPSTGHWHTGENATWTAPNGELEIRIDYVMVGCDYVGDVRHSQVVQEIDMGDLCRDHRPVGLQLEWCTQSHAVRQAGQWTTNFDRSRILDKSVNELISAELQKVQVADWHTNIEDHVRDYTKQIHGVLEKHAPKRKAAAKKPFITDEIWAMRRQKRDVERRLRHTHRLLRRECLALVFAAWAQRGTDNHCLAAWRVGAVRLAATLRCLAKKLRSELLGAKGQFLSDLIKQMPPNASASDILRGLRPVIGTSNLRKRKGASLPQIRNSHDDICSTVQEATDAWVDYFTAMEGGERISEDVQRQKWITGLRSFLQEEANIDLKECPSLVELEQAFRRVKAGKAIGLDGVAPEICHANPRELARLSYTQMLKLVCHGQEDLLHKGGTLAVAFKKGPRDRCHSYRSLLISSHQGKTIHRALRQKQCHLYVAYQQAQQLGGRPRIPVNFAGHLGRAFLRHQQGQGRPCGMLFLDLQEAYYRVLRPLAVGGEWCDARIAAMAARLNLEGDLLAELHENLRGPNALMSAGVPHCHRHYIQAIHTDTFFMMAGQNDRSRTLAGSRPGDSFADVVFGYLWAKLLRRYETELMSLGILETFPEVAEIGLEAEFKEGGGIPVLGPTWCDDLCVFFSADDAEGLVRKGGVITSILLDTCKGFGMTPNLNKNKSELLLAMSGRGSRAWKKTCFQDWQAMMPIVCADGTAHIHLVGSYQHLGGLVHHGGDQRREATRRMAIAHSAFGEHRRVLFRNKAFDLQRRTGLFKTLVLSKAVFGMEYWILRTQRDRNQLHSRLMRLYRRLLPEDATAHLTDEYIIATTELPWPTIVMRSLRLRYLGQLYRAGDSQLWSVLRCDTLWVELVKADLQWMFGQLCNSSGLKDPRDDFGAWEALMKNHPGYWKRLISRAVVHDTLQWKNAYIVDDFHREVVQQLEVGRFINFQFPKQNDKEIKQDTHYGCIGCGVVCRSHAGECAHMFKRHGVVNQVRSMISSSQCGACLKEFHTLARVQRHLMHSTNCRDELWSRGVQYPIDNGIGSQAVTTSEIEHDNLVPVVQAAGPHVAGKRVTMPDYYDDIAEAVTVALVEAETTDLDDLTQGVVSRIEGSCISWTELKKVLRHLRGTSTNKEAEGLDITLGSLLEVFDRLLQPGTWTCFKEVTMPTVNGDKDIQHWQRVLADTYNAGGVVPKKDLFIPRMGKHRIILHAYSGRRRPGDLQCFLDAIPVPEGLVYHVISLDVMVHETQGNIMDGDVRAHWLDGARKGWIHGFVAGPPCETWSDARSHALEETGETGHPGRGPRVIRTAEQPCSFDSLSIRELRQIIFGDILLGFAVVMMAILYVSGGAGLIEHPARPRSEKAASVWRTIVMQFLCSLPGFRILKVSQGHFGAPSGKPTELLTLRLSSLAVRLDEGALTTVLPKGTSLGRDQNGLYRTARLKEYPPSLCRSFAMSLRDSVDHVTTDTRYDPSDDFLQRCALLEQSLYSDQMGQDFMMLN